jgi:hypothetical protein
MTGFSEEEYEATRERWVAAACQQLKERGVSTPLGCYEAREPCTFQRWILGGNMFGDGHIREHPLVADRWLQVDAADTVTVAEGAVGYTPIGALPPSRGHAGFGVDQHSIRGRQATRLAAKAKYVTTISGRQLTQDDADAAKAAIRAWLASLQPDPGGG